MNTLNEKDLKNDSSTIQAQESGAQSSTPEQTVMSPIDAGRAILDDESAERGSETHG